MEINYGELDEKCVDWKEGGRCQRRPWGAPPPPPPQYKVWAAADAGGVWQHWGLQSLVFGCGASWSWVSFCLKEDDGEKGGDRTPPASCPKLSAVRAQLPPPSPLLLLLLLLSRYPWEQGDQKMFCQKIVSS